MPATYHPYRVLDVRVPVPEDLFTVQDDGFADRLTTAVAKAVYAALGATIAPDGVTAEIVES